MRDEAIKPSFPQGKVCLFHSSFVQCNPAQHIIECSEDDFYNVNGEHVFYSHLFI